MRATTIAGIVVVMLGSIAVGGAYLEQKDDNTIVATAAIDGNVQDVSCERDNGFYRCEFTVYQPSNNDKSSWIVEGLPEKVFNDTKISLIVSQTKSEKRAGENVWKYNVKMNGST